MELIMKVERIIGRNLSLFILLGALFGIIFNNLGKEMTIFIMPSLFLLMLFASIKMDKNRFKNSLKNKKLIFITMVISYCVIPLIIYVFAKLFKVNPIYLNGIIFASIAPTIISAPYFTHKINGDIESAYIMSVLSTLLFPLISPIILLMFTNQEIDINIFGIIKNIFILIISPILLSLFLRKSERLIDKVKTFEGSLTSLCFFLFMWPIISSNNQGINIMSIDFLFILLLAFFQEIGVFFLMKTLLNNRVDDKIRKTLMVVLSLKNTALTAGIATSISPEFSLPSAAVVLIHVPMFLILDIYKDKL